MGNLVTTAKIGSLIRSLRHAAGLSQEQLAELVGVSFQQIQKYESGHTTLNVIKLQQLAEALKVPTSDFFEDVEMRGLPIDDKESELLCAFRKIKDAELKDCVYTLVCSLNKRGR